MVGRVMSLLSARREAFHRVDLGHVQRSRRPRRLLPQINRLAQRFYRLLRRLALVCVTRQRLGDAKARELLREHERMVREALKADGVRVFDGVRPALERGGVGKGKQEGRSPC